MQDRCRTHHTHDPRWACSSSSAVSPPSYTETVPDEAEITIAVALVTVVMASAAACRAPKPGLSLPRPTGASRYVPAESTTPRRLTTNAPSIAANSRNVSRKSGLWMLRAACACPRKGLRINWRRWRDTCSSSSPSFDRSGPATVGPWLGGARMIVRCGALQTAFCISPSDLLNLFDPFDP